MTSILSFFILVTGLATKGLRMQGELMEVGQMPDYPRQLNAK